MYKISSVLPAINPFAFDQPVYSGDDVQLTCYVARGDEPIAVSWTLDGIPLDNSRPGVNLVNVGSKTSLLTMSNVNHYSDGEYRCVARNPAGISSYSANLTVYGKTNKKTGLIAHECPPNAKSSKPGNSASENPL